MRKNNKNGLVWIEPNVPMGHKLPTRTKNIGKLDGKNVGHLLRFLPPTKSERGNEKDVTMNYLEK